MKYIFLKMYSQYHEDGIEYALGPFDFPDDSYMNPETDVPEEVKGLHGYFVEVKDERP